MIVAARDGGCLKEVLVIAAALSVQDPRERPQEKQGTADAGARQVGGREVGVLSWLKLWNWYGSEIEHKKSQRKLVQICHANFLSANRMREWRDTHGQLHALIGEQGWKENEIPATYDAIHKALLTGLLGQPRLPFRGFDVFPRRARHQVPRPSIVATCRRGRAAGWWRARSPERRRLYARCVAARRSAVAGGSGCSPDPAQLLRSALGAEGDAGGGVGALDALRHRRQSEQARELRADESGRGARDLHSPGAFVVAARSTRLRPPLAVLGSTTRSWMADESLEHKSRRSDVLEPMMS